MQHTTVTIAGARGGQGTTTVAAALAIFGAGHTPMRLVSPDAPAVLGLPEPLGAWEAVEVAPNLSLTPPSKCEGASVIEAGRLCSHDDLPSPLYVVLRGPCYLGLRELVLGAWPPPDGVILVMEEGRSLTDRDVADVLGIPVVARVRHSARVARTIDAGLFLPRLQRHAEFKELSQFAQRLFAADAHDQAAA
jgi:hypothetical protein